METDKIPENKSQKRQWGMFAAGVIVGMVLCAFAFLSYYFLYDNNNVRSKTYLFSEKSAAEYPQTSDEYETGGDSLLNDALQIASIDEQLAADTAFADATPDSDNDEVDFETELDGDLVVWEEQRIDSRKVKVQFSNEDTSDLSSVPEYIEVEQWSSPIKNKHSFYLKDNILKVKGLDINHIDVKYKNGTYYLNIGESDFPVKVYNATEKSSDEDD